MTRFAAMCTVSRGAGRWFLLGLITAILGSITGCSAPPPIEPTTYPVTGKVISSEGKPWTHGIIILHSTSDPGMMASGEIQADGRFTLLTSYVVNGRAQTKPGAVAGTHTVTVQEPEPPVARGSRSKTSPVVILTKCQVEATENDLLIKASKGDKR